ncbi:MAG: PadR family transcriptional regulator [Microbacterium sp.]
MSTSFPFDPGFGMGGGNGPGPAASLWEAFDQLRASFDPRQNAPRMARGDVRAAVLSLLAEQPMHGYQIIHEIEERSGGSWKPSAGSVYPTLQLLADEGLISAEEQQGRKTYSLTEEGRAAADAGKPAPWRKTDDDARRHDLSRHAALPKAGVDLAAAAAQVAHTGTPAQIEQAVTILDDARRRLYAILAEG